IQFNYTTDVMSIGFWIKVAENPASEQVILSNIGAGNKGYQVSITTSGQIKLTLKNVTQTFTKSTTNGVADDAWHHILIVKPSNQNSVAIRIDGVAETMITSGFIGSSSVSTD